jgi:hypothetical protein
MRVDRGRGVTPVPGPVHQMRCATAATGTAPRRKRRNPARASPSMTIWRTTSGPPQCCAGSTKAVARPSCANFSADTRPLTHAVLDELAEGKPLTHLRSVLVATRALPPRDEQMARRTSRVIADRDDPGEQQLLHAYAVWHLLRRLRARLGGADTTRGQAVVVQQHIRAAIGRPRFIFARRWRLMRPSLTSPINSALRGFRSTPGDPSTAAPSL